MVEKLLPILAILGCFALSALADPAPGVKTVLELKPGPDNPRNSEGAFMPLKDGRIMFAYSRYYGKSGSDHATADIAARYSSDNGATWTTNDAIIVRNHGGMNVMSVSLLRLQSGEIALFYLLKNSTSDCRPVMRRSFDEGRTWSEPAMCITDEVGYFVLNNDRVVQLRDGRLLFAVALHSFPDGKFDNEGVVMTYFSDDNGRTWRRGRSRLEVVAPDGKRHAAQEPGVVECRDGSVLLWIRTNAGCQYMCRSTDRGETFSAPQPSPLVSPLSPASIKRLPTGDLLALWNDHGSRPEMKSYRQAEHSWANGCRTPLAAALSGDDGKTWKDAKFVESDPDGWFCYIAVEPLDDGTVLLGYCAYKNLAHLRIVKVPVSWFAAEQVTVAAPVADTNATVGADGAARPIDVGSRLQVLWDDFVVDAEKTTARRVLHHPEFAGSVMTHDRPWEGDGSDYHCIVPDIDDRGEFLRMYYNGVAIRCGWKDVRERFSADGVRICYAESWDGGLTWAKPNLGIVEFMGSKENNCILDEGSFGKAWDNFLVLKDANPACPPEERYKGVGKLDGGLWCFLSSDGIRFRKGWPIAVAGAFDSLNVAFWDNARGVYHLYFRGFHKVQSERNGDLNVRDVRHSVSKDFRAWSEPKLLDFGEGAEDYALYTNLIQPYFREPSIFVGFPSRYVERKAWTPNYDRLPSPEKRRWRMDKAHGGQPRYGLTITDCIFVFSRDGQRFFREDDAFMRPGPENPGNWVYGDGYPAYRLVKTPAPFGGDDEISIYSFDRHWSGLASNLNRWRIRQDGFVSRHGAYAGQKVVTKPLVFTGSEMLVNFSTSARGRMFVAIRDASGSAIKSVELFGDKVDRVVDFAADAKLSEFQGRPVVVEVDLSDADIYSFRFKGSL